jgi:hypothetical protein
VINRQWQDQYTKFGSYEHEIARGNVKGAYPFSSYGKLTTTGAASDVLIQDHDGSTLLVPPAPGVQMSIVSNSANDAAAGTGARTIVIEYLDGNLDFSFELITLNGTTPVNTIATDIRWVQAMHVATAGSGGKAAGQIDLNYNGNTYSRIITNERTSHSSLRRVPRNKKLFITSIYAGSDSGSSASRVLVELLLTQINGLDQQETGLFYSQAGIALQDNSTTLSLNMPLPVEAGHIIGFNATCDKAATITAGFIGWIEDAMQI